MYKRQADGTNFSNIGSVNAINTSVQYTYNFTDQSLSQSFYYYRIRIVEQSGSTEFSSVLLLKSAQTAGIAVKIFPNPVTDMFTVSFENKISGPVTVKLTDLTGKEIWKQETETTNTYNLTFSFAGNKPVTGIYIVKLYAKNEEAMTKIFIK